MNDHQDDHEAARRRSAKRTVAVLAVVAALIYLGFIGRGVLGIGS